MKMQADVLGLCPPIRVSYWEACQPLYAGKDLNKVHITARIVIYGSGV